MKNLTLRQLRIFAAVARHSSFSRAAEELHLTQPAVSMQVHSLEESAGLPLTEQLGKKVRMTAAGDELARLAHNIEQQLRDSEDALAALKGARGGHLQIGVVSTAKYFAPALLAEFSRRHPGIDLRLSVNNRSAIVRALSDNHIDLAIMGAPPREFTTEAEAFADHPLVFIAAPDHPLTRRRKLDCAALLGETMLIRETGSGTRQALERLLDEQGLSFARQIEMGSNETIKQAVMAGMGIAFISAHTIDLERSVGRLSVLKVVGTPLIRQWHLVHRQDKRLLPAADAFRAFMREEARKLPMLAAT
jgi:LysR family transcriptional regulator, low CO2-responsive transcriptional regulator